MKFQLVNGESGKIYLIMKKMSNYGKQMTDSSRGVCWAKFSELLLRFDKLLKAPSAIADLKNHFSSGFLILNCKIWIEYSDWRRKGD